MRPALHQVLSAPELRRRYDAAGASAVAGQDWLEPGAFFAALFGSELFEHLVGELAIATMAQWVMQAAAHVCARQLPNCHTLSCAVHTSLRWHRQAR